jgi:hypothetical protein
VFCARAAYYALQQAVLGMLMEVCWKGSVVTAISVLGDGDLA